MNRAYLHFIKIVFLTGIIIASCKKERSCENCLAKKPPVANAGPDQIISLPTDSALLNGSASGDPGGTITSYSWKKINGPVAFVINNSNSVTSIVKNLLVGNYEFELTVTDNDGLSDKDSVIVQVNNPSPTNRPPIANAGPNQTLTLPTSNAILDGSVSTDPDNNITGYIWTKISGPAYFNITNHLAMQTSVDLAQGNYVIELKVTDAAGLFSLDTMEIIVNPVVINVLPVANAGPDATINFDLQTCNFSPVSYSLNGSGSTDPDGNITQYTWSGPGAIANSHSAITTVSGLLPGTSWFYLTVRDNNGGIDVDTLIINIVGINRPIINAQLTPFGTLSEARYGISVASAGNKIVFAGGNNGGVNPVGGEATSRVDIYDVVTHNWSTAELSVARMGMAVAVSGNKIFFAAGWDTDETTFSIYYTNVDIYDASTDSWTVDSLSVLRGHVAGGAVGTKVFFAGGWDNVTTTNLNVVDIYDLSTNSWSAATLSEGSRDLSVVSIGNRIYFAGGYRGNYYGSPSSRIDIYDNTTSIWSTSTLIEPKAHMASIAFGGKIYWAGGNNSVNTSSSQVEIKDVNTQTSVLSCLFQPNVDFDAVEKNNKIVFFTGEGAVTNKFDIYDVTSNNWSIGVLSLEIYATSIISVNNTIYVAGGYKNGVFSNQVWKLEF